MKLVKLLLALMLLTQLNSVIAQDDMNDDSWSEESSVPATATPAVYEDAAGEDDSPVYDNATDY